ncbi:hypothetical protein [Candidatus Agathobaculum pullicola]|uniref:hypothetical protein n=1 Tax=Candidatus Agathobaculum pullicola TaxID=2838426 RepID=UPI003F8E32B9
MRQNIDEEGCVIEKDKQKRYQMEAAQKQFEWFECSKPDVAAQAGVNEASDGVPEGIALPPHERGCGRAHPMRGTNSEDLTDWCINHET